MSKWKTIEEYDEHQGVLICCHVVPTDDVSPHNEKSSCCPCDPNLTWEGDVLIITHNSFDGREAVEWANEILEEASRE